MPPGVASEGGVVSQQGAIDLQKRSSGEAGQLGGAAPIEVEEDEESFGDDPEELAMGHVQADIFGRVDGKQERAFLDSTGADAALLAGEGDEELVAAFGAAHAGEAVVEEAAPEQFADGFVEHRPPVAEFAGVAFGVDATEVVEVFFDEAVEVGFLGLPGTVDAD